MQRITTSNVKVIFAKPQDTHLLLVLEGFALV